MRWASPGKRSTRNTGGDDVLERFTKATRQVVQHAVEEAESRADARVGTEHLLLGLLRLDDPAARVLGADVDSARRSLAALDAEALASVGVRIDGEPDARRSTGRVHRPFTGGAKSVLVGTLRQARLCGSKQLAPAHLALALVGLRRPDTAARLLERLEVDCDEVARSLLPLGTPV